MGYTLFMWSVATTDEFDEWFAALGEADKVDIDAKIVLSERSVPPFAVLTPTR